MEKLRTRRVNRANWDNWEPLVLHHMRRSFPRKLWWTKKNFEWMFDEAKHITRVATVNGKFAGFIFGIAEDDPKKILKQLPPDMKLMHAYYLFLAPEFRAQGIGTHMLAEFIAHAKKHGYDKLSAFAKVGPSLHNVKKLGMTELEVKRNFYNTGDTYVLCAMDL